MSALDDRISKIEAVQHFQLAMIAALVQACLELPGFKENARRNLQMHQAQLAGESTDEVKLKAYEELMESVLGPQG